MIPFYLSEQIEKVYCKCGCGIEIGTWKGTDRSARYNPPRVRGEPKQFAMGHAARKPDLAAGLTDPTKSCRGYRRKVEQIIEIKLPKNAEIHHVDRNHLNNQNNNLVVRQDIHYHRLLHRRMLAYETSDDADYLKCRFCKQYDNPAHLTAKSGAAVAHVECSRTYYQEYKRRKELKCQSKAA